MKEDLGVLHEGIMNVTWTCLCVMVISQYTHNLHKSDMTAVPLLMFCTHLNAQE